MFMDCLRPVFEPGLLHWWFYFSISVPFLLSYTGSVNMYLQICAGEGGIADPTN